MFIKLITILTVLLKGYSLGCVQENLDGYGIVAYNYFYEEEGVQLEGVRFLNKNSLKLPYVEKYVVKSIVKLLEDNPQENLLDKKGKSMVKIEYIYKKKKNIIRLYLSDDEKIINVKNNPSSKGLIEEWLKIKSYQGRPLGEPLPKVGP